MSGLDLREVSAAEVPAVVEIWVEAYSDDPYLRWLQPDPVEWPAFARDWMTHIGDIGAARGHLYLSADNDVAASWIAPGVAFAGPDDILRGRKLLETHLGDSKAEEVFDMIITMRSYMPSEPHWGLNHIGVRPVHQGKGRGTAAVTQVLAECDRGGFPCTLVSGNPRNQPFFERLGFAVLDEIPTPDGAAVVRPMRREPRSA